MIDESLRRFETVWCAAGTPHAVFEVSTAALIARSRPRAWWTLANEPAIDVLRPRSVAQILGAALSLYRRYPVLFLVLAFVVTAPYELIVLAALGTAPIGGHSSNASTALILVLVDVALVGPLISALYAHAVVVIARSERPKLTTVASSVGARAGGRGRGADRGGDRDRHRPAGVRPPRHLPVDPLGSRRPGGGARAHRLDGRAATEWRAGARPLSCTCSASSSSPRRLTSGSAKLAGAIGGNKTNAADVIVGIAVGTLIRSFAALTTALLYFDLLARERPAGWTATPTDGTPPPD